MSLLLLAQLRSAGALTLRAQAPPLVVSAASAATMRPPAALRCARLLMCDAPAATAAPPAEAEETGPAPFEMLDVRVGKIVEAWEHPDSEKLWCEKIDVGEEEPREIASGIRAYYATAADLAERKVLVVCNLKPAKLGGFASNGMVLCASSPDKSSVAFVEPPAESEPGERVVLEGAESVEPASANKVKKKKLLEKASEDLKAVGTVATYRGKSIVTAAGPCTSPSISEGTIS